QNVAKLDVTLEPVRQFLPAVFALAVLAQPRVAVFLQPHADLAKIAAETIPLALQECEQPTFRLHRAARQGHEPARFQRQTIAGIKLIGPGSVGALNGRDHVRARGAEGSKCRGDDAGAGQIHIFQGRRIGPDIKWRAAKSKQVLQTRLWHKLATTKVTTP